MRVVAVAVAGAALLILGGCASLPENPLPAIGDAVDSLTVQSAAAGAMVQVGAYVASNMELPATLAEAGFSAPDGVTVSYAPGAGIAFSVCAQSGDIAFLGEGGSVSEVESC